MASAFWTLEDGRTLARRWTGMAYLLQLITDELKAMPGADQLYAHLKEYVFSEENGDIPNGFGGFIRGDQNIMLNIDLRKFTYENRNYFWLATQQAFNNINASKEEGNVEITSLLATLLDMHNRIQKGEDPMLLNDLDEIAP